MLLLLFVVMIVSVFECGVLVFDFMSSNVLICSRAQLLADVLRRNKYRTKDEIFGFGFAFDDNRQPTTKDTVGPLTLYHTQPVKSVGVTL